MRIWTWMDNKSFDGYLLCTTIAWIQGLKLTWILCLVPCAHQADEAQIWKKIVWQLPLLRGSGPSLINLDSFSRQVHNKCSWCWAFKVLKSLISNWSLKMDWQKVSQEPQFWDKSNGHPLWTAITWTPEVQLTWIHFLTMARALPGLDGQRNCPKSPFLADL